MDFLSLIVKITATYNFLSAFAASVWSASLLRMLSIAHPTPSVNRVVTLVVCVGHQAHQVNEAASQHVKFVKLERLKASDTGPDVGGRLVI